MILVGNNYRQVVDTLSSNESFILKDRIKKLFHMK